MMFQEFLTNVLQNLFKPLLLFFYAGLLIPALHVKMEFPKAVFQGLTIYLLLAIGWHGGEELAGLEPSLYGQAAGFMLLGFFANTVIGFIAYQILLWTTRLRRVDAATVAGHYGSDSAGAFVTAVGVLTASHIAFAPYMPVMLAIMEIPGCLVALYLVSSLRRQGMDVAGNMPTEAGYLRRRSLGRTNTPSVNPEDECDHEWREEVSSAESFEEEQMIGAVAIRTSMASQGSVHSKVGVSSSFHRVQGDFENGPYDAKRDRHVTRAEATDELNEARHALQDASLLADEMPAVLGGAEVENPSWLSRELLHEVFLNPGIFLLFVGVVIGFVSRLQGEKVTAVDDALFVTLLHGVLCLFQLEMGRNAAAKFRDLAAGGWQFVVFAILAPNIFAGFGLVVAHLYSTLIGQPFGPGTYVLFAILCGSASTIAVPAVQRLAIPEASPTLPLVASLGLTFTYNVTIGIPAYMLVANHMIKTWPVSG